MTQSFSSNSESKFESTSEFGVSYLDANSQIKTYLEKESISMSSPIKLQEQSDLEKYCTFFTSELQDLIEYCTSTELLNSDGMFLGNIHMVGSKESPGIIIASVQTDPFLNNLPEIKLVFRGVIENMICTCWEELASETEPPTIAAWIDKVNEIHTGDNKIRSKSNVNLSGSQLLIELTTNTEGYLWELIVTK